MNGPAHQASDRAARWILRQEEPGWTAEEQAELDAWLDESTLHRAAYLRLRDSWRRTDAVAGRAGEIAPIATPPRKSWQQWAIAASFVAMLAFGGVALRMAPAPVAPEMAFVTNVGGHETVALADGSKIELNTATRVRAAISDEERNVWLDQGEAYFEVAHLEGRPFVVHAGTRTVTVLGTKFSVRRDGERVSVAVAEGRVRVDDAHDPKAVRSAIINGGDLAIARGPSTIVAVRAQEKVEDALAWRDGMLSFESTTLGEAAAEFSRYNGRPIVITDPKVAEIRIDGAFQASNVDAFLRLLDDAYGLHVEQDAKEVRISG